MQNRPRLEIFVDLNINIRFYKLHKEIKDDIFLVVL